MAGCVSCHWNGCLILPLRHGEPVEVCIRFEMVLPVSAVTVGIVFSTGEGTRLLTYDFDFPDGFRPDFSDRGTFSVDVTVGALPLGPDIYNVDIGCRSGDAHGLDYVAGCQQVEVMAGPTTPGAIVAKGVGSSPVGRLAWSCSAGPAAAGGFMSSRSD